MQTFFTNEQLFGKLIIFDLPDYSSFLPLFVKITNGLLFVYFNVFLLSEKHRKMYNMTVGTYVSENL